MNLEDFSPFLDGHLMIPLIEFAAAQKSASVEDLNKLKLKVLKNSNLFNYIEKAANKNFDGEKKEALAELKAKEGKCEKLLKLIDDKELTDKLRKNKDFHEKNLFENFKISAEEIESLATFAQAQYNCGQYQRAGDLLAVYRELSVQGSGAISILWGILSCSILTRKWQNAQSTIDQLQELFAAKGSSAVQRAWLLHWSLFVFFHAANGSESLLSLFMSEKYLGTLLSLCPHLLRYLIVAVVQSSTRRPLIQELTQLLLRADDGLGMVDVAEQVDPVFGRDCCVRFLRRLLVACDYEAAERELELCAKELKQDFFVAAQADAFVERARRMLYELYCRVHSHVDIGFIAEKLSVDNDAAELWLVDVIGEARLNAQIDSANNRLVIAANTPTAHELIRTKTEGLSYRSNILVGNLERVQQGIKSQN